MISQIIWRSNILKLKMYMKFFKFHATRCTVHSSIPLLQIYCVTAAAKSDVERYSVISLPCIV